MRTNTAAKLENQTACPHCGADNPITQPRGQHLGLYCGSCGRWLTWLSQGRPINVMPFGSYKGEPIKNLPRDYVKWLLNHAHVSKSLRRTLEAVAR
jgi:Putative quorum-sensing-regulated virulence factor